MIEEKEKWWICKNGKAGVNIICPYQCKVKVSFKPRGCLWSALFQDWEEVKEEKEK